MLLYPHAFIHEYLNPVSNTVYVWNVSRRNGSIAAEKVRAGRRHAAVCPNVTGRTKDRIAQSKRALRARSLAIVD